MRTQQELGVIEASQCTKINTPNLVQENSGYLKKVYRLVIKQSVNHFTSVDVYTRKAFSPTVKREDVLRHYSRNSYSNFGKHAIFLESSGSRLGDPGQKALQTTIIPLFLWIFA